MRYKTSQPTVSSRRKNIFQVPLIADPPGTFVPPTPPGPCDIGTWDFTMECQSAHIMTAGF